jgi:hypothetical protein
VWSLTIVYYSWLKFEYIFDVIESSLNLYLWNSEMMDWMENCFKDLVRTFLYPHPKSSAKKFNSNKKNENLPYFGLIMTLSHLYLLCSRKNPRELFETTIYAWNCFCHFPKSHGNSIKKSHFLRSTIFT